MKGDLISINGKLRRPEEVPISFDRLMASNFVYQRMHAIGQRVLQAPAHAALAQTAYRSLYGAGSGITENSLREETAALLAANRYMQGSVSVMLYLFPDENGKPLRILSCEKQLLYKGYALWHRGEKAVILPYEYPFPHFKTALSLAAGTYAAQYAQAKGAGIALAENHAGILYGAGDEPLFAVIGNNVLTTPVGQGACDSVERRLALAACVEAGKRMVEAPLTKELLDEYQELFIATTGGITSVKECGGNIYPNSTAHKVAEAMEYFTYNDL